MVLVTGSGGFIFSIFVRHTLYKRSDYDIVSIDKIATPDKLHNIYANKGHALHIGDVADSHFVNTIFELERPDIVIHGAAESHVDNSIESASQFILSNVLGTQTIVDACVKYGVDRLIYISTDEVYGQLPDEDAAPWTEDMGLSPRNPYSASKAAGELLVTAASNTHGLKYNITRSCNNFGPRQATEKLIPKVVRNILEEKPIPIYGAGKQLREWIYVTDNCSAMLTILEKAPANETYNISTGYETTSLEMANNICNCLEKGHNLISFVTDRAGHDFRYAVDSTKLRDLGWSPQYKFKKGLERTILWYTNNQWFLKQ